MEQDLHKRRVISISSIEGSGSPLGWLCMNIKEAADSRIAGQITSLGCTMLFARPVKSCVARRIKDFARPVQSFITF